MATAIRPGLHAADDDQRVRLEEFEQIVRAITRGEVDAFVVSGESSEHVLTLGGADRPYRLLAESMQQGGLMLSADGKILYANPQFARIIGGEADVAGRLLFEFVAERDLPTAATLLRSAGEKTREAELCVRRGNGCDLPAVVSVVLDRDSSAIFMVITDLTEPRRLQALMAEEALSASIFEQSVDAIVVCDVAGTILRVSHTARDLCAMEPIGMSFDAAFPLSGPHGSLDFHRFAEGKADRYLEYRLGSGPEALTVLLSVGPVLGPKGGVLGVVVTMTDIEERKRGEDALREAHDQLAFKVVERTAELTNLSHHLIDVGEEERASVARELHDDMGSVLTVLSMQLTQLDGLLRGSTPQVADLVRSAIASAKEITASQRRIVNNLLPVMLHTLGLSDALRQHAEAWQRHTGISTYIDTAEAPIPLEDAESLALFRVLQESLTNVVKHARASIVSIVLAVHEQSVILSVVDDGVGMAPKPAPTSDSHGIIGMRERLLRFGGSLLIAPGDDGLGTRVEASMPCKRDRP